MKSPIDGFSIKPYPEGCINQYYAESVDLYKLSHGHNGWDIIPNDGGQAYGRPVYAMFDCVVLSVADTNVKSGYGNEITMITDDGLKQVYGHLSQIHVVAGQEVKEGDFIGNMGNSGFVVTGPTPFWKTNPYAGTHLHITNIWCEPANGDITGITFSDPKGRTWRVKNYGNQDYGAVNPAPIFAGIPTFKPLLPRNLTRGDIGLDVEQLQTVLWMEGLLERADIVGQYGPKTQTAVFAFQKRYNLVSLFDIYRGRYCGPKTISQINFMYGSS